MSSDYPDIECQDCDTRYPHLHIMPMVEILGAESSDSYYDECVLDVLKYKREDTNMIKALTEIILSDGFQAGFGICYDFGVVRDGHHRLVALYDLGAQWCPVQGFPTYGKETTRYQRLLKGEPS